VGKFFVGVPLEDRERLICARIAERLADAGVAARFEAADKYHATLAFLGFIDEDRLDDLRHALDRAALGHAPFSLKLDRIGAFPHEGRPRVVWLGSRSQSKRFRELALGVRESYATLGFSFKDDIVAHVTLARIKGGAQTLPMLGIAPANVRVDAVELFESMPAGRTTRYEVRHRVSLAKRSSANE